MVEPVVDGLAEAVPAVQWRGALGTPGWLVHLDRLLVVVRRLCEAIVLVCMVTMVTAVTAQVLARTTLPISFVGADEVARYAMTTAVFFGLPVLAVTMTHIRLDALFTSLDSSQLRHTLVLGVLLFEAAFMGVFAWLSWDLVGSLLGSQQRSAALEVRLLWPTLPILLGSALAAGVSLGMFVRSLVLGPVRWTS